MRAALTRRGIPALLVALLGVPAPTALAWCQMTTSSTAPTLENPCVTDGVPLSWRRGCMAYAVDHRGSVDLTLEEIEATVDASFGSWLTITCGGQPTGLDARGLADRAICQDAEYRTNDGNVNTIAFVSDWEERDYDPAAFAITTVWHNTSTGEILDVDMLINEQLGPYAICPATGCATNVLPRDQVVDLQNVVTHEAGHFFGVAHSEIPNATMYLSAARGETIKRTLESDDREALCNIYPPGQLAACTDFSPRGGLDLNCEDDRDGSSCAAMPGGGGAPSAAWLGLGLVGVVIRRRWKL